MKKFNVVSCFSLLVGTFLTASPSRAITYVFRGSDTYDCGSSGQTCQITYNDFSVSWDGASWSSVGSPNGSILFRNTTTSATTSFTSSSNISGDNSYIQLTFASTDLARFNLAASPTNNPGDLITFSDLGATSFFASSLNATDLTSLAGTGSVQAVPFIPSILALLPLGISIKRKKIRSLLLM